MKSGQQVLCAAQGAGGEAEAGTRASNQRLMRPWAASWLLHGDSAPALPQFLQPPHQNQRQQPGLKDRVPCGNKQQKAAPAPPGVQAVGSSIQLLISLNMGGRHLRCLLPPAASVPLRRC